MTTDPEQSPSDLASIVSVNDVQEGRPTDDAAIPLVHAALGDRPLSDDAEVDGCPDGGYGWVVIICMTGIYSVSFGKWIPMFTSAMLSYSGHLPPSRIPCMSPPIRV